MKGKKLRYALFFLIIIYLFSLWDSDANSATINAASCSRSDVVSAINSASNGDTVLVPSGNCTWTSGIIINKDLSIIGAGKLNTKITYMGDVFILSNTKNIRISGFGFTDSTIALTDNPIDGKSFRIDNNSFTSSSWRESFLNAGGSCSPSPGTARMPTGLIDNNEFTNHRLLPSGTNCMLADGNYQHQLWARPPPKGTGTEVIYIEDNTFTNNGNPNVVDASYGGRYVFRFNTINGTGGSAEIHSVQGANRAVQWTEIYKNTHTRTQSAWYPFLYYRGGTSLVWGNRISNTGFSNHIIMNNVRSCRDPGEIVGKCNGSSNWDQNTPGQSGWGCRDQIGRSYDESQWSPGQAYAQPLTPAYIWDNTLQNGTQMQITVDAGETCPGGDLNSTHIQANRDYYTYNASFNGTSGVGMGPLANRPSTCTTGVGYWATDQGSWNQSGSGGQGVLYKCTATNIWTAYYTPYTYPHPLRNEGPPPLPDTQPPTVPTNLTATAVSSSQINLSWTASTDNVGVAGYRIYRCQGAGCTPTAQIATSATNSYSDTGLAASNTYVYRVAAYDAAGNVSGQSSSVSATTQAAPDTTPPSTPTNLTAAAVSSSQINLSWTASTDNVGVTGYRIYRCQGTTCAPNTQIATSSTNSYQDTGLTANTTYRYRIRAYDAAGNLSSYSSTATATTQAPPDTTPPAPPTGLSIQ